MNHNQNAPKASAGAVTLALAIVYLVWGSTYLAIHYAVLTLPPFIMASIRFLSGGTIMYAWLRWRGTPAPTFGQWMAALLIGALLLGGGNGGVVWAQRTVPSGLTAILVSVIPLWMAVFELFAPKGERPTWLTWIGLLLGFGGLLLLLDVRAIGFHLSAGLWVLLLAPISWALGSVLSKRVQLPPSPFMATAAQLLMGGVVLCAMTLASGELRSFQWSGVSAASRAGLNYLTALGGLVGFTSYVWLLKNAPLPLVSTYAYVNPLVAVLLGWLFVGEGFTSRTAAAGGVILLSVAITGFSIKRT
jgi:drug/metabolite transporter (DMT)-like permease